MLLTAFAALSPLVQAPSEDFRAGDIVIYDPGAEEIALFDPVDGTKRDAGFDFVLGSGKDTLAWDPHRARLIFFARHTPGSPPDSARALYAGASDGSTEVLTPFTGIQFPECVAAADDGRIYFRLRNSGGTGSWRMVRPDGTQIVLTDSSTGLPFSDFVAGDQMEYHAATNSLIVVDDSLFSPTCSGSTARVTFHRYPLSADGESVGPAVQCVAIEDAEFRGFEGPQSRGLSAIDENSFLATFYAQPDDIQPRLWRLDIDPAAPDASAMSVSLFSTTPTKNTAGGTWSSTRGEAIVLDNFFEAIYAVGEGPGAGSLFIGEDIFADNCGVVQITSAVPNGLTASGQGFISVATGGEQDLQVDFPDAGSAFYYVAGSLSGFSPFFPLGGVDIPIAFDTYTSVGLSTANTPPFVDFLGLLVDGSSSAPRFVVPAGTDASLIGLTAHHAAIVIDLVTGSVTQATNAVAVTLVP